MTVTDPCSKRDRPQRDGDGNLNARRGEEDPEQPSSLVRGGPIPSKEKAVPTDAQTEERPEKTENVGTAGFEPATSCTPYMCATELRHVPNFNRSLLHMALHQSGSEHRCRSAAGIL